MLFVTGHSLPDGIWLTYLTNLVLTNLGKLARKTVNVTQNVSWLASMVALLVAVQLDIRFCK